MAASLRLSALAVAAAVDQAGRVGAEEKVRNAICTALVTSAPPNPAVRDERAAVMRLAVESPCFYSAFILRAAGIRKEVSNFLVEVLPELTAPSLLLPRAPVPYGTRAHHLALWDTELQAPRLPEASSHGVRSRVLFVPGFTASSTYPRSRFLGAPMAATVLLGGLGHAEKGVAVLEPNNVVGAQLLSWFCSKSKVQAPQLIEVLAPMLRGRALPHGPSGGLITGFAAAIPRPCRLMVPEARLYHKIGQAVAPCGSGTGGRGSWAFIRSLGKSSNAGSILTEFAGPASFKTVTLVTLGFMVIGGSLIGAGGLQYYKLLQKGCRIDGETAEFHKILAKKDRVIDRMLARWSYMPGQAQPPLMLNLQVAEGRPNEVSQAEGEPMQGGDALTVICSLVYPDVLMLSPF